MPNYQRPVRALRLGALGELRRWAGVILTGLVTKVGWGGEGGMRRFVSTIFT